MYDFTIRNVGRRILAASKTITGNAPEEVLFSGDISGDRTGILLKNHDGTLSVYAKIYQDDEVPTVSSTDCDFELKPYVTLSMRIAKGVRVAVVNSSGDATPSQIDAVEYML